jgi:hypothetical protein
LLSWSYTITLDTFFSTNFSTQASKSRSCVIILIFVVPTIGLMVDIGGLVTIETLAFEGRIGGLSCRTVHLQKLALQHWDHCLAIQMRMLMSTKSP